MAYAYYSGKEIRTMYVDGYDTDDLSKTLMTQLKNLVHGNQTRADKVDAIAHTAEIFTVNLNITWYFRGHYEERRVAGSHPAEKHCGDDLDAFQQETAAFLHQAETSTTLRQPFIYQVIEAGRRNPSMSMQETVFHTFEQLSVHEPCPLCQRHGKTACSHCGGIGRKTCVICKGSGQQYEQIEEYHNGTCVGIRTVQCVCKNCNGSGQITCEKCVGSGNIDCQHCSGYGIFTIIRHIQGITTPKYKIGTTTTFERNVLDELLTKEGPGFCCKKIPLCLEEHGIQDADSYTFVYSGKSIALQQQFAIRDNIYTEKKIYTCMAFSNPPYPYVCPAIFDDLFVGILDFLVYAVPHKNSVRNKDAVAFFRHCIGQPALAAAMRNMAKNHEYSDDFLAEAVNKACQSFISKNMAANLAQYLNLILDRVSPTHSTMIWRCITIPVIIYAMIYTEDNIERLLIKHPFISILDTLWRVLVMVAISVAGAWLTSTVLTLWRRRKIPYEYWKELRNNEIMMTVLRRSACLILLAGLYGMAAAHNRLPRNKGVVITHIRQFMTTNICPFLPTRGCERLFRLPEETTAPIMEFENMTLPPLESYAGNISIHEKIIELDDKEKVARIQHYLSTIGYSLNVDGKFGKKTKKAADDYLQEQDNIVLSPDATIADYYESINPPNIVIEDRDL